MVNEIFLVRKDNLKRLILDKYQGNKASFSRASGIHPNHTNLLCSENQKIARNMGEDLARRIEAALGLPPNWMDTPHGEFLKAFKIAAPKVDASVSRAIVGCRELESVVVTEHWISRFSNQITTVENLMVATVATSEMEPIVQSGATVVIDTGVKVISTDGIYILTKNDVAFIRQIRRTSDGGFSVSVANTDYRSDKPEVLKGMRVVGRIVCTASFTSV